MANFKSIFKTEITESVYVETFALKKKDFIHLDIMPPVSGHGYMIICSEPKLLHGSIILLNDNEEKAKLSHDSAVILVKKALKALT